MVLNDKEFYLLIYLILNIFLNTSFVPKIVMNIIPLNINKK